MVLEVLAQVAALLFRLAGLLRCSQSTESGQL
jgi:hypothetical protein